MNEEPSQVEDAQKLQEDIARQQKDISKLRRVVNGELGPNEDEEIHFLLGNYDSEKEALETQKKILDDLKDRLSRAEQGLPRRLGE